MLVLTRDQGEVLIIRTPEGQEIQIMNVETRGNKVRLGIEADKKITIHRKEIQEKVDRRAFIEAQEDDGRPLGKFVSKGEQIDSRNTSGGTRVPVSGHRDDSR